MILIENKPGHDGDHEVLSMITGQQDDDQKLKINAMKRCNEKDDDQNER